jgi:hypothetical protein
MNQLADGVLMKRRVCAIRGHPESNGAKGPYQVPKVSLEGRGRIWMNYEHWTMNYAH